MHLMSPFVRVVRRIFPVTLILLAVAFGQYGRSQAPTPAPAPAPTAPPAGQQPQTPDQATPDAGGPGGDNGVIAMPKKKDNPEAPPVAPPAPKFTNPEGAAPFSLRVEVPEVSIDVGVLVEKTGQFVPGLKPGNFRVYENGVVQNVVGFKRVEAPITALMLCEFARNNPYFVYDMRNAAYAFSQQLRPQDYIAMMTFDIRTRIVMDFTQDKQQLLQAINTLQIPDFRDTDLFDALYEALDRMSRIEGRKYIVLIASGRDTLSKLTYDKILLKVKATPDVTIFAISTGGSFRVMTEGRGGLSASMRDMDYMQADNEMKNFASITGGKWFNPRFEGELPDIFKAINESVRSKYQLVYHPTNAKQDGTYRKLRVELVDNEGQPLHMQDEKHKALKYDIITRDGYRAKQEVE